MENDSLSIIQKHMKQNAELIKTVNDLKIPDHILKTIDILTKSINWDLISEIIKYSDKVQEEAINRIKPALDDLYIWKVQQEIRSKGIEPYLFPFPRKICLDFLRVNSLEKMYDLAIPEIKRVKNQDIVLDVVKSYIFEESEDLDFIKLLFNDYNEERYHSSVFFLFLSDKILSSEAERVTEEILQSENHIKYLNALIQKFDDFTRDEKQLDSTLVETIEFYRNDLKSIKGHIEKTNSTSSITYSKIRKALSFLMALIMDMDFIVGEYARDALVNFSNIYNERDLIAHGIKRKINILDATKYLITFISIINLVIMNSGQIDPPIVFIPPEMDS